MKKLLFLGLALLLMANYATAADNRSNVAIDPTAEINELLSTSLTVNFPIDLAVQQFRITTTGVWLDIRVIDCCIAGDLWSIRALNMNGGVQDVRGVTNGTSAGYSLPVPASAWWDNGGTGRVWLSSVGGQSMDVLLEVRATKSNAVSPSSAFIRVRSHADVVITTLTDNSISWTLPIAPIPLPTQ